MHDETQQPTTEQEDTLPAPLTSKEITTAKIEHNITTAQAAKILMIHPGTLANWRVKGVGPAFEKNGDRRNERVLYNREELREFAKSMKKALSRR